MDVSLIVNVKDRVIVLVVILSQDQEELVNHLLPFASSKIILLISMIQQLKTRTENKWSLKGSRMK